MGSRSRRAATLPRSAAGGEHAPIAILGLGCVLPGGCDGPAALWRALESGGDLVGPLPDDRWSAAAHYSPDPAIPGKTVTRWGGFLQGIREFDAAFFGISPREAALVDPQQRLLLQVTWEALEDAGIPPDSLAGSATGVYVGISNSDYHAIQKLGPTGIDVHTGTGGALSIAANRISHRFDLRGPSIAIDTACSSALVALDAACRALWSGECTVALAGGVNVMLTPEVTISFSRASMLSPDGRCMAFDARANGYVRGEGAGVVVLKPLAAALADGDRIQAIIRATAVNQDGHTSTITVPSQPAQEAMLREACRRAAVDPALVGYVEAHGTGTAVGDPIEAGAIGAVFGRARSDGTRCLMGSIKTNVGHLESAAGIAGVIKAVLCLRHGAIPPNLHFVTPNPDIPFAELGIAVPTRLQPWPDRGGRRLAAVNSFGFGGTNACALLEAWPDRTAKAGAAPRRLVVPLSAASATALATQAGRIGQHLEQSKAPLAAVAATLAHRRAHLDHRLAVVAGSRPELARKLLAFSRGERAAGCIAGRASAAGKLAFVFTGQGAQWWAMGRGLLAADAVFRAAVEACDRLFQRLSGWSLIAALLADEASTRMGETAVAQPAMFALQVALAERWRAWGVVPDAVVGHSIGEIAAAYVSGALSLEDAVTVVYHRSRLQERSRGAGAMAAIGVPAARAGEMLAGFAGRLEIAAINGPSLVTVAGDTAELDRLLAALDAEGSSLFRRRLEVDLAFHSRQMDPHQPELTACLGGLRPGQARVAMISTVTAGPVADGELDATYWWRNMRQPVLFQPAIDRLIDDGHAAFLEIGPHAALAVPVTACLEQRGRAGYVVASLRRGQDDRDTMLQALGELHVRGHAIAWEGVIGRRHGFVDLPGNPWEKHAFWTESEEARAIRHDVPSHPLLGHRLRVAEPVWQVEIGRRLQPFLSDHCVDGAVVFPAAAYLEMLLAAARELFGDGPWEAEKIVFHEALMLGEDESAVMQTIYEPERSRVSILSRLRDREAGWTLRTTAQIRARPMQPPSADGWATLTLAPERIGADRLYRDLASEGHQFGPAFRGIELLWRADGMALGRIATPAALAAGGTAGHLMHPAILDSCLQVIRGFRGFPEVEEVGVVLPIGLRSLRCFRAVDGPIYSQARQVHHEAARVVADIVVFDEGGNIVASLDGFECRRWPRATPSEAAPPELYRELWRPRPDAAAAEPPADRPAATWLIFADRRGIGEALAAALEARGESCLVARVGERSRRIDKRRFELRVDAEAPLDRLLATARRARPPLAGIVHLWAIDGVGRDPGDAQLSGSLHLLALAQRLVAEAGDGVPRLWACGAGAWQPDGSAPRDDGGLATATLSGLCRALRTEHPQLRCTLLDLPLDKAVAADLAAELLADGDDAEVLLRPTGRHVGVIQRVAAEDLAPAVVRRGAGETALPFALTLPGPGRLDSMALREIALPVPGPGEVVIEVRAAGLNFRDVMAASGLLPAGAEDGDAWRSLGLECAGVVASVGDGVSRLRPGDEVIALARGCFASHLAVPEGLVFDKPKGLGFVDAACLPTAFLTAWHALVTQGRMTAGERVLITAAAGGVGQAAIQVATALGAEIYATAGSVEKRDHLRRLGIRHVFDSRSLDFADEVMAASDGAGVDLILNSQPGAFIEKGLSVLAPFGRFLEIGKRDIYLDTPVGLHALRNNASIMAVDLGRLPQQRPALLRDAMTAIFAGLESGTLRPLPVETFAVSRAADAFRRLSQARHIGKVALVMDEPDAAVALNEDRPLTLRPDGTYLVTGGLGGFGLATARWLADRGARRLLLLGRSAASAEALEAVAALGERGVEVRIEQADVTDLPRLESLVASIDPTTPLRGLVHAAMVLDDGFIRQLDADRFAKVVAPKMLGAWNLHRATAGCPLDFFVLYSSISALTGAAGQANYAAGNRYLDALAEHRRRCGLPALSIAWGAIADAGYLTRREDVARYLGSAGIEPMAAAEALAMLGRLLNQDVAAIAYARVDWAKLAALNPAVTATSRFAEVTAAIGTAHAGVGRIAAELAATPPAARPAVLTSYLQDKVGSVLRIDPAAVEPTRALAELGLDSLTSFELKGKVERELGVSVPIARFLQRPSVATLVAAFIERLDSAGQDGGGEGFGGGADDGTLSHGQEALWFLHRLAPTSPAYNLVYCVQIQPAPDGRALQEAFRGVLARHRVLRGAFLDDQGVPVQRLLDPESFSVEEHDARSLDDVDLRRVLSRCGNEPFTVTTGPLIQLHQFHRRDGDALLLKIHHLVVDAWSLSLVLSDLFAFYFAARDGVPAKLPPLSRGYADYVRWSRALVARPEGQVQLAYWRRQLADAPPLLELPTDRPRPATPSGEGGAVGFTIGAATTQKLRALAAAEGVTLFAVLLAAYQVLLLKLTGQRDLLVGVPVSGRSSAAFDQVVGYFVNPVVVRGQLDDAAAFAALLRRTDATVRAALEHQDYPFPLLVQALQADRDAGRSPLFQVAFAMERSARVDDQGFAVTLLNVAGPKLSLRGHAIETVGLDRNRAQFDLGFTVEEFDDRLYGIVDYRSDLFEKATIERFASWYDDLLARVAERPSLAIGEIALGAATVAPASGWRDDEFPDVVAAILAAARAAPENPAVSDADGTLSYRALVGRAAAVAAALKRRGAAPGSLVGIAVSRSAALPVALLGTLLAGAAFVPLDLAHPPARLATILDDAAPVAIVTETALLGRLPAGSPAPLLLDALEPTEEQVAAVAVDGAQLAYLIYTSGSTGAPAGVRVPRRALANFIGAMRRLALLQAGDRLLAVTTPSFDIALLELLLPLAVGATTVVADEATCRDGRRLARRLESDAIDVMQATPATWAMLVDAGWAGASGFTALCGGEALPADLAAALLQRADAVWNLYGPTETTIWSTAARLVTADERPIGWPIANTLCRVLDDQSRPVPLGAVGELWIGGAGLADGYHRRPEATAARFVTLDGERFFRTGDLVRQSEDGALAFIARRDRQLKLRGFRIEPGEIEAALRLHPDVAAAAVATTGDDLLRHRLVALVVPRAGGQVDAAALRSWLGERLPSHAVPADCRMVGALPLTANGKLDRGALANLAAGEGTQPRSPREPRSRDEIVLGQIAAELLGPEPIGVDDDLYERGATSLLMVRLVARAGEALGIDLAVTDLAGNPTIARLARRVAAIRERGDGDEALGLPAPVAGPIDWRPLALRRAADEIGPVEAVALAYLPDDLAGRGGTTRRQIAAELFEGRPSWHSVEDTPLGRIGLVVVPLFGADLFVARDVAAAELNRGIALAGTLGARCVSLTGLIPAATDFGRALEHRDSGPALTTGHATTAAAMVLSIANMLEQADRRLEDEAAAFVGLGSIGQATLRLMLDQTGHPAMLILCDLPARRPMLEALAEELRRDLGYHGRVVIATAAGRAPDAAYSATLLVGATNVPDVVDVARLAPGTLVVDDSFPPCLPVPAAAARLRTRGDILFTAGGFVRAPGRITRAIALPPAAARFAGHAGLRQALGKRVPDEITGCILSALLSVVRPDLPAQLGPVGLEACRAHLHALRALGFGAASLGTDAIAPTQVEIAAFRQRFGALDAA